MVQPKNLKVFATADIHDWHTWLWDKNERDIVQPDIDLVLIAGDVQDRCTNSTHLLVNKFIASLSDKELKNPYIDTIIQRFFDQESLKDLKSLIEDILPKRFPNAQIVIIPGNHDNWTKKDLGVIKFKAIHIVDELSVLKLTIKNIPISILCCPYTTYDAMFKGNGKSSKPFKNRLSSEKVLLDKLLALNEYQQNETIDILLSHVPPYSILDKVESTDSNVGSPLLLNLTNSLIPSIRYHVFGHNHISPTTFVSRVNSEGIYQEFYNVSCRSESTYCTDADRVGVEFDYYRSPSNSIKKKFLERWKFMNYILGASTSKVSTVVLEDNNKCQLCSQNYKLQIAGCPFCKNCLKRLSKLLTPYNLNNQEFKLFESWYQMQKNK